MGQAAIGRFAVRHSLAITFITVAVCLGGVYAALHMPSSVFPQTNFPRVVVLVDNGVMPADQMMATVTRPIEEAMKDIPGCESVRSSTSRGSAEVNVFFSWDVNMVQAENYAQSRLAQIRNTLPPTANAAVWRLTFAAFPIIGVSVTSPTRDVTDLWETARYTIKPRFLQIPGVARVDLAGGGAPELHVVVDPLRLAANRLSMQDVTDALAKSNVIAPTGMHEENHLLYLTVVDGRAHSIADVEGMIVSTSSGRPVRVGDIAHVERSQEPVFTLITAEGVQAVLLNIRAQPDASTLDIADGLTRELEALRKDLPSDVKLAYFYDQSLMVRASVRSVTEAIIIGLILSVLILYLFLKNWGTTLVATVVIPVTVLFTIVAMKAFGMSYNLMTLGGIAAAIGLIIDDAIVVVEAIYARMSAGGRRLDAVQVAVSEIFVPLVGSTLTPVVVFVPLAFLDGLAGVFFRSLALTMVVALLTSLLLAVTLTPSLAAWLIRTPQGAPATAPDHHDDGEAGPVLRRIIRIYEVAVRLALANRWTTMAACLLVMAAAVVLYPRLDSDFLPEMDEGGFVVDYETPPGTSLAETDRQMRQIETMLKDVPELESYSRRTGVRLALAIAEPNRGGFMIKLKADRKRTTSQVMADLRRQILAALPQDYWDFHDILGDMIGDMTWEPKPIEVKIFSPDVGFLRREAPLIEEAIKKVPGVVSTRDGLVYTGPSISLHVREEQALRYGFRDADVSAVVRTAMLGQTASSVLEGDRLVNVRVRAEGAAVDRVAALRDLPLRTPDGSVISLGQIADIREEPGQLELRRENLRQDVAVSARLQGRDLGSAMADIRNILASDPSIPPGTIQYGGLYQQQQESFRSLLMVLATAILLVFTVLLIEFRSFYEPTAIVFGAVLALFGTILALLVTGTPLSIVAFLGAIIGVGIVAKNGILMLDFVDHLVGEGVPLQEALVRSGRRRLRPVLMTSLAAALGMLPLAYGIGSGADMLQPLAIAVIGAVCISVLLSLVATPVTYFTIRTVAARLGERANAGGEARVETT